MDKGYIINANQITMTKDMHIEAKFIENSPAVMYTLTIAVQGEGVVLPVSGSEFKAGTVVTLNTLCKDQWVLKEWAGPDQSSVTNNTITMTKNMEITAIFEIHNTPPTVTLSSNVSRGSKPLSATFVAEATDDDLDQLFFRWELSDIAEDGIRSYQTQSLTQNDTFQYTFNEIGPRTVTVYVSDGTNVSEDSLQVDVWGLVETQLELGDFLPTQVQIIVDEAKKIMYLVASDSGSLMSMLGTLDISNPQEPTLTAKGWVTISMHIDKLAIVNNMALFMSEGVVSISSMNGNDFSDEPPMYSLNVQGVNDMVVMGDLVFFATQQDGLRIWKSNGLVDFSEISFYKPDLQIETYKIMATDSTIYLYVGIGASKSKYLYNFEYQYDGMSISKPTYKTSWGLNDRTINMMTIKDNSIYVTTSNGFYSLTEDLVVDSEHTIYGSFSKFVVSSNYVNLLDDSRDVICMYERGTCTLIGEVENESAVLDIYQNSQYSLTVSPEKIYWGYLPY